MNQLVLVDSSAWIEAVRKGGNPETAAHIGELIISKRAAMTEPIWLELYQGIRSQREEARLVETKRSCVWLSFDDLCWKEAAAISRTCLRAGVNVPFGDVLVYACAKRHGVELLDRDRHFEMIRKAVE